MCATHAGQIQAERENPLLVDFALQGGGSHGAFTWGVLDRALQVPWMRIEAVSGTSAGAMNAAVMIGGYEEGGPEGARAALERFWRLTAEAAQFSPFRRTPIDVLMGRWTLDSSPFYFAADMAARVFSPYDINPMGINPLRDVLESSVDFARLVKSSIHLFVTATNVRTGKGRVFHNEEVTPDVLLASACLPTLFQAVEIDGEIYWDGGYAGNPTITPLVRDTRSRDTIIVQINPVERANAPRSAQEIHNRLNEISFNSPLLKELRMIALLRKVVDPGSGEGARWAAMRIHRIASKALAELGASSKLNAEWDFLCMLRDQGRLCAETFYEEHGNKLGHTSSFDLDELLAIV